MPFFSITDGPGKVHFAEAVSAANDQLVSNLLFFQVVGVPVGLHLWVRFRQDGWHWSELPCQGNVDERPWSNEA